MASQPSHIVVKSSKIPRYVRTQIPVSSLEYLQTLKAVKEKKAMIEKQECDIKVLRSSLERQVTTSVGSEIEDQEEDLVESQTNSLFCRILHQKYCYDTWRNKA
jgi:hypothetical protein